MPLNGSQIMARDLQALVDSLVYGRGQAQPQPSQGQYTPGPGLNRVLGRAVQMSAPPITPQSMGFEPRFDTRLWTVDEMPSMGPAPTDLTRIAQALGVVPEMGGISDSPTMISPMSASGSGLTPPSAPSLASSQKRPAPTRLRQDAATIYPDAPEYKPLPGEFDTFQTGGNANKDPALVSEIPIGNRMTSARRWSGMDGLPGGGLEADPLGATRMSQPIVGGAIGPDANDLARQAAAEKHQAEINALDAISGRAAPLWADLPSSKEAAFKLLMQRSQYPLGEEDKQTALYMAGNLNEDPLGRYGNPNAPVKFGEPGQRKYSDERLADLNTRQKAVEDRARRKGEAREMRMGGGDALAMDKQMQMFQAMGGGGNGGGGTPSTEALIAFYGPQVGAQIAEHYRLSAENRAANERGNRALDIQDRQTKMAEAEAAAMHSDQILKRLPADMQRKPGLVEKATTGETADESVINAIQLRKNSGQPPQQIAAGLIADGYPVEQVNYLMERVMPTATQPGFWDITSQLRQNADPISFGRMVGSGYSDMYRDLREALGF